MDHRWFGFILGMSVFLYALVSSLGITEKWTVFFVLWIFVGIGLGVYFQMFKAKEQSKGNDDE